MPENQKNNGLANRLRTYNEWRRGAETEQPSPAQVGKDIDAAIVVIESSAGVNYSSDTFERDVTRLLDEMMTVGAKAEYFGGFSEISETGRLIIACAQLIRENLSEQKNGAL